MRHRDQELDAETNTKKHKHINTDPLTQQDVEYITPGSVAYMRMIYSIRDQELHTISQKEPGSELVNLFLVYLFML